MRRIRNSLSAKAFLWVFGALAVCSTAIYAILLTVLPKQYQIASDRQTEQNADMLVSELNGMSRRNGVEKIYSFCIQNNAAATLTDGESTLYFGEIQSNEQTVATSNITADIEFSDGAQLLILTSLTNAAERISRLMLRFLPVIFCIILLLSALSAFICSRVIAAPVAEISGISESMAALDMTRRCGIKSGDEIGVLARSLNTMADRLQAAMLQLENANARLREDVTKFQALEEQRKSFFAAVSHELKTPLTVLKGQLENMILGYGDYKNREKYLPEALKSADDIENLVKEIIAISKAENMDLRDSSEEISLLSSVGETVEALLPLAKGKDIRIHQNIDDDIIISVNRNLWQKALSNIIGNAVRHSPEGAEVFISMERENVLAVENTGVFIPEDDIKNVFAPFYRADKSRSKATGGSGLGLYIVKTVLDLHGMGYSLQNTPRGVMFLIHLK